MINRIKKGMSNKCNNEDKEFYKDDPDDLIWWVDNRESLLGKGFLVLIK